MKTAKRLSLLLCALFVAAQPALAQNGEDTRNKAVMTTDDGERLLNTDEISIIRFDGPKVTVVQPWGETVFDRSLRNLTFIRPLPGMLRLTVTTALNGDDAVTRGVDINGSGQLAASWKAGDQVYVYPDATTTTHIGTLTPETTNAKTSKLTGDVTATGLTSGQTLYLSTKPRNHSFATQTNSLDDLFYYKAEATVTITGGNASIADASFSMAQSITRFTLQDGSSNAVNATQLVITGGTEDITVTSTPATNVFYVAMPAKASTVYSFTAITSDSREWTGTKTAALVDGKYYRATVTLTKTKLTVTDPASTMTTAVTAKKNGTANQSYTGSPLQLVTAGVSSAGTLKYRATTTNTKPSKSSGTWTTTVPTATAAGTYYVWYYAAGNDDYNATDVCTTPVTVTIDKAAMTGITATAYNAAYDGSAHGITVNDVPAGATVTYSEDGENYREDNYTYTDVVAARTVYYKVSKANYSDFAGSSTVTINKKTVTVSGITAANKTYDGTATATLNYSNATFDGIIAGDELTITAATYYFTDVNVGTERDVALEGLTLGGTSVGNYQLAESGNQNIAKANISKAMLTATAENASRAYGVDNPPFTVNVTGFVNGETESTAADYTRPIALTTATPGSAVGTYDITPSGGSATNYDFTYTAGTLTVTNATLSVTANDYSGVYDGAVHGITVTCEGATIRYRTASSGDYNLTEKPTYTNVTAATTVYYQVTKDNYTTVEGSKTVTITQKPLTITAKAQTISYGASITEDIDQVTVDGLVEGDALTSIALSASTTDVTTTGTITPSEAATTNGIDNYAVTYTAGTLTITAVAAAVSEGPMAISSLTYSGNAQALVNAGTAENGTMCYAVADTKPTETTGFTEDIPTATDAGTYKVWYYAKAADANHSDSEISASSVDVTIAQKALTITAKAQTISYGASITEGIGQVTVDGLVDDDALTSITLSASTTDVTSTGTITPSAAATTKGIANYSPTYNTGTLTITAVAASVSGTPAAISSLTYSGSAQALVNAGTAENGTMYYAVADTKPAETTGFTEDIPTATDAGTYKVWYYVKAADTNHSDSEISASSVDVTIAQKALTITAKAQTISYGASITEGTGQVTVDGLVDGDALTAVTLTASGSNVTNSGTITPSDAGTSNGIDNYAVTYTPGTLTITAVASAVTTPPTGKTGLTYNGSAQELVDATSAACTGGTLVYSKTEGGTYGDASTITETDAGTYSFYYKVQADGNHTDSDPVQVTGVSIAKANAMLNDAPAANTLTYTGSAQALVTEGTATNGTVQYKLGEGGYSTDVPTATNAGDYTVYYKVVGNTNYNDVAEASVSVTINKAAATLTCNNSAISFSSTEPENSTKTKTGVSCTGGTINVASASTGNCTVNYFSGNITVMRKTNSAFTNTQITVSVTPDGNHTAPSNVTFNVSATAYDTGVALSASSVGYVVATDALCYPAASFPAGKTKAGVVVYKSGSSGLVVSLTNLSSKKSWTQIANSSDNPKTLSHMPAVSDRSWVCGTKTQYSNMWGGGSGCSSWSDFNTKITNAGGTALGFDSYWSCTEGDSGRGCLFYNGSWGLGHENSDIYVRPLFAF